MRDKAAPCRSGLNWLLILLSEVQDMLFCVRGLWEGGKNFLRTLGFVKELLGSRLGAWLLYNQEGNVSRTFCDIYIIAVEFFWGLCWYTQVNTSIRPCVSGSRQPLHGINVETYGRSWCRHGWSISCSFVKRVCGIADQTAVFMSKMRVNVTPWITGICPRHFSTAAWLLKCI